MCCRTLFWCREIVYCSLFGNHICGPLLSSVVTPAKCGDIEADGVQQRTRRLILLEVLVSEETSSDNLLFSGKGSRTGKYYLLLLGQLIWHFDFSNSRINIQLPHVQWLMIAKSYHVLSLNFQSLYNSMFGLGPDWEQS